MLNVDRYYRNFDKESHAKKKKRTGVKSVKRSEILRSDDS
jgi:hypothetical protein